MTFSPKWSCDEYFKDRCMTNGYTWNLPNKNDTEIDISDVRTPQPNQDFDVESIPVNLQHDAYNSWGVIMFARLVWKFQMVAMVNANSSKILKYYISMNFNND